MLRWLCIFVLLGLCFGQPVDAGAWPRAKGEVFLSLSVQGDLALQPASGFGAAYLEWGATERLTLGFDIGRPYGTAPKLRAFLRLPLPLSLGKTVTAIELGIGQDGPAPFLRPSVSVGRSLSFGHRSGWLNLDLNAEIFRQRLPLYQADLTFGLALPPRLTAMVQLNTSLRHGGQPQTRLASAVLFNFGKASQLEFGLSHALQGPAAPRVKLSLWQRF